MTNKKIEERYIKLSHKEHILKRSETYIGANEITKKIVFTAENYNEDIRDTKIVYKEVEYNPSFIKIFDEIITNASDHSIRTGKVKNIKVNITDDTISIENDGDGIPVVIHPSEKIYIPELIFGHLLTGENYDDTQDRYVGGRNGYGAKLTNIYSTLFKVETADGKKTYRQKFSNNMSNMTKPYTRKSKQKFTRITYKPDFDKFSMSMIDEQTRSILIKRIFDIAAYNPSIRVQYNGRVLPVRSFRDYIKLFIKDDADIFYEKVNDNWEIAISESPVDTFTHVSMVNGISTNIGGTHVNYISNYIVNNVKDSITKSIKGLNIRPNDIKNRLLIFVNCKLPNPIFDNQTKENLTLKIFEHVRGFKMNDSLMRRLSKSDMFQDLIELSQLKEKLELERQLNKQVNKRIRIEKLFDANNAGKLKKSENCHLFLTEGDCLYEDTLITVLRDYEKINIKIKDVKIDDIVITHESKFRTISNISKKIQKSVKIKLKNGNLLICSETHKWFIYDKEKKDFYFIETKNINPLKHKMILNRNIHFNGLVKINDKIKIKNDKFDYMILIDDDEILSTKEHKFSVLNINTLEINMIECEKINKDIHFIVNYEKI